MRRRHAIGALCAALALLLLACTDDPGDGDAPTVTEATLTPTALPRATTTATTTVSATPAPTPSPTPEALNLAFPLKLVRLSDGTVVDLPLPIHDAVWSPDSRRLAYVSRDRQELILLEVETLATTTLSIAGIWEAVWTSPSQLAVATHDQRAVDVFDGITFIALDGTAHARIEASGASDLEWSAEANALLYRRQSEWHVWGPDGAFEVDEPRDTRALWLTDGRFAVLGQGALRIYSPLAGVEGPVQELAVPETYFSVSPSGQYVSFITWTAASGSRAATVATAVIEVATGEMVVRLEGMGNFQQAAENWSRESERLMLLHQMCTPEGEIVVAGLDGAFTVVDRSFAFSFAWSPDGTQIAYTKFTDLWVAASDGNGEPRRLIDEGVHSPATPRWSPDGQWITAYTIFGGYGACE